MNKQEVELFEVKLKQVIEDFGGWVIENSSDNVVVMEMFGSMIASMACTLAATAMQGVEDHDKVEAALELWGVLERQVKSPFMDAALGSTTPDSVMTQNETQTRH